MPKKPTKRELSDAGKKLQNPHTREKDEPGAVTQHDGDFRRDAKRSPCNAVRDDRKADRA